ncbi:transposase [Methylomonas fluvii]|uniref:transposase n=1 Tax=Methylomonas fluvii TaxID=1854564 RepID=UPI001CE1C15D|nr:transposase [Methylomonas fluvii]
MLSDNPSSCVIAMRPGKLTKLTKDKNEKAQLLRRARGEQVFRDIKIRFGYAKNRYHGLAKNTVRLTLLTAIANVLRRDA